MKRSLLALTTTLLTATLALSSVARADEQSDYQEIKNRYRAEMNVLLEKSPFDINQALASYAPNWALIYPDGKVSSLENIRSELRNTHSANGHFTYIARTDVLQGGDGQTFKIRYNLQTVVKYLRTNQNMDMVNIPVTMIGQFEDTWANTPGGWRLVSTYVLKRNDYQGQPQAIDSNINYMNKLMLLNQGYVW